MTRKEQREATFELLFEREFRLEETPEEYINRLVEIFREVRRVLKEDGTLWLNIGDTYNSTKVGNTNEINKRTNTDSFKKSLWHGAKQKDLIGIPWMLAFALRADGWYLRQDIIWHKPNPMPESVKDRCTKAHEYIFLLSKSPQYYFDYEAIQELATGYDGRKDTLLKGSDKYQNSNYLPNGQHANTFASTGHERWKFKNLSEKGQPPNSMHLRRADGLEDVQYAVRNKRDVWSISTKPFKGAHFATFPEELVENCLLAGCPVNGVVLDPFMGSGTVGLVAKNNYRNYVGIDLNPKYIDIANARIDGIDLVEDKSEEIGVKANSLWG
jgi:DNA modification methylase